ncbi:hypothetical protein FRC02_000652 [Tulasnella sp. 418]|nr:hypothetical protein FRC02_000652 [Tulasnella sp. 418]
MGYKNLDPSHPCSKCWQKYGTPYTGALTYAPWSNPGPNSNYQRPLPRTLGPAPRPPLHTRPTGGRSSWGGSASPLAMPPPVPWANHPGLRGATSPGGTTIGYTNRPPPGALVVQPGDPRIGGRLCWKCGGDGEVLSFPFIIDRCRVCDGLGRIV